MFLMENMKENNMKSYYHSDREFAPLCNDFENKKNPAMISISDKSEKMTDVLQREMTTFQLANKKYSYR